MTSNRKKLSTNVLSLVVIQLANYLLPMISIPVVYRVLGPEKLGSINFASSFVAYYTLLIGFGFDLTATRKVAADPENVENRNSVFSAVFFTQAFLLLCSTVVFGAVMWFIPETKADRSVLIFTYLICLSTVFSQNWLFQAMQDLPKVAVLNLVSKGIFTIVVLIVVRDKSDYIWYPLVFSLVQVVTSICSFIWATKKYGLQLRCVKLVKCLELIWNERIYFFSLCIISVYTNTNVVILAFMQDHAQVGLYTAGQRMISILQSIIIMPISHAFFPYLGRAFAKSRGDGLHVAQRLIPIVLCITGVGGVGIWLFSPFFVHILYGAQFESAIIVCRILAFVPLIIAMSTILGLHVMMNLGMDKIFFKVTMSGAIASIMANFVLVQYAGFIGSAINWLLTEFFIFLMLYFILLRRNINMFNFEYFNPRNIRLLYSSK